VEEQGATQPTPINKAMGCLSNGIGTLEDLVKTLTQRLASVTSPELTVTTGPESRPVSPLSPTSAMHERIIAAADRIDGMCHSVDRLLQRLEV
jgi:hypothetical protein